MKNARSYSDTVDYKGVNEILYISKYQLLLLLERLEKQKSKFPLFEHVMIPFSVLLTTLIPLLTTDFRDSLWFTSDVWRMFILALMVLSGLTTAVLLGLWVRNKVWCKTKTPEEIVDEIIKQMKRQRKK